MLGVIEVRTHEVDPGEEPLFASGRGMIGQCLQRQISERSVAHVAFASRIQDDSRQDTPVLEALRDARIACEVDVAVNADGANLSVLQKLGEKKSIIEETAGRAPVARQLEREAAREHSAERHRRVARERIGVRIDDALARKLRESRRYLAGIADPWHVGAKGVDGDEQNGQVG